MGVSVSSSNDVYQKFCVTRIRYNQAQFGDSRFIQARLPERWNGWRDRFATSLGVSPQRKEEIYVQRQLHFPSILPQAKILLSKVGGSSN